MKLVRSWPEDMTGLEEHPRVLDNCERLYIPSIDYSPLLALDDNVLLLEWDVVVGKDELRAFARKCLDEPDEVRVAPTRQYNTRQWRKEKKRNFNEEWFVYKRLDIGRRTLEYGEPYCNEFAFGVIYLPYWAIKGFMDSKQPTTPFIDRTFAIWFNKVTEFHPVPVEWDTNAIHMNYSTKDALAGLEDE